MNGRAARTNHHPLLRLALLLLCCCSTLLACGPVPRPQPAEPTAVATATVRLALTPALPSAGPPAPTPITPPTGLVPAQTIVFVSDRDGQVDLYLTDVVTGQVLRLTNDKAIESFPTWSPDGTRLAYVVEDDQQQRNLWILDLRTGQHRQLTTEVAPFQVRRPAWLRGGQVLIYDTGKPFDRRPELRAVTVDGQSLAPISADGTNIIYDWSTNGDLLICAIGQTIGEPRLALSDAVPGAILRPDRTAPVGFAVELAPAGRFAAFSAPPLSDDQVLFLMDLTTGSTKPLNETFSGRRYEHDFAWLPDNRRLVLVHGTGGVTDGQGRLRIGAGAPVTADGNTGLWLINSNPASNEPERVHLTTGSADAAPRPSPDGRWIVYLTDTQKPNPYESLIMRISVAPDAGAETRVPKNLTPNQGNNWSPVWMPLP